MLSATLLLTLLASSATAQSVHGASAQGTMGPVAFLWPADRAWDASSDNTAPCGSTQGIVNRTRFPLAGGGIELTIADPSWDVKIAVAVSNDPKTQSEFDPVVSNVASLDPGHQCYKFPTLPVTIGEGINATIQLQYTSNDKPANKRDTFYACADITFVAVRAFTEIVPCFNVTADQFISNPSPTAKASTAAVPAATGVTVPAPSGAGAAAAAATSAKGAAAAVGAKSVGALMAVVLGVVVLGM